MRMLRHRGAMAPGPDAQCAAYTRRAPVPPARRAGLGDLRAAPARSRPPPTAAATRAMRRFGLTGATKAWPARLDRLRDPGSGSRRQAGRELISGHRPLAGRAAPRTTIALPGGSATSHAGARNPRRRRRPGAASTDRCQASGAALPMPGTADSRAQVVASQAW